MSLTIDLPQPLERRLTEQAAQEGTTVSALVARMAEQCLPKEETFAEILAPIRQEVAESGMSEEELGDFFAKELADLRRERREAGR